MKTDKLAKELDRLLNKYVITDPEGVGTGWFFWDDIKDLANEYAEYYHILNLSEITNEDIEAWAEKADLGFSTARIWRKEGAIIGAKAMRDGEIKTVKDEITTRDLREIDEANESN